jgi:hypothetical protein
LEADPADVSKPDGDANIEDLTPESAADEIDDPEFQALFSSLRKTMRGKE